MLGPVSRRKTDLEGLYKELYILKTLGAGEGTGVGRLMALLSSLPTRVSVKVIHC